MRPRSQGPCLGPRRDRLEVKPIRAVTAVPGVEVASGCGRKAEGRPQHGSSDTHPAGGAPRPTPGGPAPQLRHMPAVLGVPLVWPRAPFRLPACIWGSTVDKAFSPEQVLPGPSHRLGAGTRGTPPAPTEGDFLLRNAASRPSSHLLFLIFFLVLKLFWI